MLVGLSFPAGGRGPHERKNIVAGDGEQHEVQMIGYHSFHLFLLRGLSYLHVFGVLYDVWGRFTTHDFYDGM